MERERKNHLTPGILQLDSHYNRVTCTLPSRNIYYLEPGVRCLLPRGTLETEIYLCSNNWRVHLIPVWIFQPQSISCPIINNGGRQGSQAGRRIIQIASTERDKPLWQCICRGFEWQGVFFFFFLTEVFKINRYGLHTGLPIPTLMFSEYWWEGTACPQWWC